MAKVENWVLTGDNWEFIPENLVCDVAVVLGTLVSAAALLEWRRRRLASAWQFTLRELLLGVAFTALMLGWCKTRHNECQRDSEKAKACQDNLTVGYTGPVWLQNLVGPSPMGMFAGPVSAIPIPSINDHNNHCDDSLASLSPIWKSFAHLESLHTVGMSVGRRGFDALASLPNLRALDLCIEEAGVSQMDRLTTVEELSLAGTGVDGVVLGQLGALPRLQSLVLRDTLVNDDDCGRLRDLRSLEDLTLWNNPIAGQGLAALADIKGLRTLGLHGEEVTDATLSHIAQLTNLTQLDLSGTAITDAALSHIERLANLTQLSLSRTGITDLGLAHVAKLTRLRVLLLTANTKITSGGIARLKPLNDLRVLEVGGEHIDDECAAHLCCLPRLRFLDVWRTHMTIDGLLQLQAMKSLDCLCVTAMRFNPQELKRLHDAMPRCVLRAVQKNGCIQVF